MNQSEDTPILFAFVRPSNNDDVFIKKIKTSSRSAHRLTEREKCWMLRKYVPVEDTKTADQVKKKTAAKVDPTVRDEFPRILQ